MCNCQNIICTCQTTNCNCADDPCGCKISSEEVVYVGPALECTGIENCDTLTEIITKINTLACSDELIQNFINVIINNPTINEQFVTIINQGVTCETIWACATTTTTTTSIFPGCIVWTWEAINSLNESTLTYIDCDALEKVIEVEEVTNNSGTICVLGGTSPTWNPAPSKGAYTTFTEGEVCSITTTTTTTTL